MVRVLYFSCAVQLQNLFFFTPTPGSNSNKKAHSNLCEIDQRGKLETFLLFHNAIARHQCDQIGRISPIWQYNKCLAKLLGFIYLVIGKILTFFNVTGQIFIAVNGQILNK